MFEFDPKVENVPKGPRVRSLAPGFSNFIIVGVITSIIGPVLCQEGGFFNYISDQLLGTHIGVYYSTASSSRAALSLTVMGYSVGPLLIILGPISFFYGLYESTQALLVTTSGIRVSGTAEMVEEKTWETRDKQGNTTIHRIFYLNYRYKDQNANMRLGQAKLDDEHQGPVWKQLISRGKTAVEVIYLPAKPTDHVALFREPAAAYKM